MRLTERFRYRTAHPDLLPIFQWVRGQIVGATIVSSWEGDGIYAAIQKSGFRRCLEIGFATGSTACLMLKAVGADGEVISIDRAQTTHYQSIGLQAVQRAGLSKNHRLIEEDSIVVLSQMWKAGEKFDFVFVDGWKTFDHLAAELYFIARLVKVGGLIVFDDAHMPSVRRAVGLAKSHYQMTAVDIIPPAARAELRAHALYAVLRLGWAMVPDILTGLVASVRKTVEIEDLPVSKDWNFYAKF